MENLNYLPFDMSFDLSSLIAGLLFGIVGYGIFGHARKRKNVPVTLVGVCLMIYPYFVEGAFLNWLIGFLFCGVAFYFWKANEA